MKNWLRAIYGGLFVLICLMMFVYAITLLLSVHPGLVATVLIGFIFLNGIWTYKLFLDSEDKLRKFRDDENNP